MEKRPEKGEYERGPLYKPTAREAALLLLCLIESRNEERDKPMTRVRLAEITLKRLWNREQLSARFLSEVGDWLLSAGWTLFFAGSTYAAVQTAAVANWPSVSSKRIQTEIDAVRWGGGKYDFSKFEHLFSRSRADQHDDDQDD
jgi:hypothetical protein